MGAAIRAEQGPRACGRLAAIEHVLGADCTHLSVGWDWAAKTLEFKAPGPLTRAVCRGAPQPIPTFARAAAQSREHKAIEDAQMPDTLDKSRYPPVEVERTDAESSVTLNTLIPQCEDDTQPAVPLKGITKGLTPVDHLAHWIAKGKGGDSTNARKLAWPSPPTTHGGLLLGRQKQGISWPSRWKGWKK